jgi:hypothetical protein
MNTAELLTTAITTGYLCNKAKHWAAANPSDEIAAQRAAILTQRRKLIDKTYAWFSGVAILLMLGFLIVGLLDTKDTHSAQSAIGGFIAIAGAFVLIGVVLSVGILLPGFIVKNVIGDLWASELELRMLSPISGTYQCEAALRHLEEGGPLVAAWRDIALTQRSQLLGIDCDIMQALHSAHDNAVSEAEFMEKRNAACRKVHGLEPAVSEPSVPAVSA